MSSSYQYLYGGFSSLLNNGMLFKTLYDIDSKLLDSAKKSLQKFHDIKNVINQPVNDPFYDIWQIKDEFKGTVWEHILSTLPFKVGEARIIKLDSGKCYLQHADIDDRYHLNIAGDNSFLVDVDTNKIFPLENDCCWYEMDAGKIHSAINLGTDPRYQLVVRKLLSKTQLDSCEKVQIYPICNKPRYQFDNFISPWLNRAAKRNIINYFKVFEDHAEFFIDTKYLSELEEFDKDLFSVKVIPSADKD